MARQRNNIAKRITDYEVRELICRLLFDGADYASIRAAAAAKFPNVAIHNSTLLAYQKSGEYKDYVASRKNWDTKLNKRRWAAGIIAQGQGAQSVADMAELAILEQLHDLAVGGAIETGKDVATVAKAITAMQRTQLARAEAGRNAEIERLKAEHYGELVVKDAEIATLQAECARLAGLLQAAGIDVDPSHQTIPGGLSPAALRQIEEKAKLL